MSDIPTRTLGSTGYDVTLLGFGASMSSIRWTSGKEIMPEEAGRVLNGVLDLGINYIDTAISYGKSEEYIGASISHRRDEYMLATKCGTAVDVPPVPDGQRSPHLLTKRNIVAGVEQSLRRMNTDYLDVLQIHGTYGHSPTIAELEADHVVETFQDLKREGKIRFSGISSTLPNLADHIDLGAFDILQIPYNLLEREHSESISAAAAKGAGAVVRGATALGVLSRSPGAPDSELFDETWSAFDAARLDELLEGASRTEFMIRFAIAHPDLATVIVGTLNLEHLQKNVAAVQKGPLEPDVIAEAMRRLNEIQ
jgi:aryl-alcohol dehydrogenase-like predicted oxidoreductase